MRTGKCDTCGERFTEAEAARCENCGMRLHDRCERYHREFDCRRGGTDRWIGAIER